MRDDAGPMTINDAQDFGAEFADYLREMAAQQDRAGGYPQLCLDVAVEIALRVRAQLEAMHKLLGKPIEEIRAEYSLPADAMGVPLRLMKPDPIFIMFMGLAHGFKQLGFQKHPGKGFGPENSCNTQAAVAMTKFLPPGDVPAWLLDIVENGEQYAREMEMHFSMPAGNA